MNISKKKKLQNINKYIRLFYLTGALVAYSAGVAMAVPQNVTLPTGGQFVGNNGNIAQSGSIMDIVQNEQNAVIKWQDFSIGGNATVNFSKKNGSNFNVLNYVNAGPVSEIYGTINANNGNVFIVNPAGVTIGKSAQINVGSLYVSNQKLGEAEFNNFNQNGNLDSLRNNNITAGELMHLGYINAAQGKVTFVGDRIVLDANRIRDNQGQQLAASEINVTTKDEKTDNLVIGYNAYNVGTNDPSSKKGTFAGKNNGEAIAKVNGKDYTKNQGYMWIDNVQQLQAMNTNVDGNYALHNSIDAVETGTWTNGFTSVIGKYENGDDKAFSGSFDGLSYSIFDLNIEGSDKTNVGLFAQTDKATIKNINMVGGTIIGGTNVGAIVGSASNTTISNITTSANVTGGTNVGGVVGSVVDSANGSTLTDLVNIGGITGTGNNVGGIVGSITGTDNNVSGIAGSMNGGTLSGNTYNIGRVTGGYNVGGLVGYAKNAAIGEENGAQIYNKMDISGGYNVGGIVGSMDGGKVVNAANYNSITATGSVGEEYYYYGATKLTKPPATGDASLEVIGNVKKAKDEGNSNKLDGTGDKKTAVANVGGIVGSSSSNAKLNKVSNEGDIQSVIAGKDDTIDYYKAGNVGGIVGRAEDTVITDATNKENNVKGAHNVGGIAGYLGATKDTKDNEASIKNSVNNGGFIYGTGARDKDGHRLTEWVRPTDQGSESNIIGNVGGIAGYVYGGGTNSNDGGSVSISNSGNRGLVSVSEYYNGYNINRTRAIANVGGIAGKLDVGNEYGIVTESEISDKVSGKLSQIKATDEKHIDAVINNSYNSGTVTGMQNVGGIVGMMYNGSVADSYNLGNIKSLVNESSIKVGPVWVNMGGIVGGTTENVTARGILYNVYNDGVIGDSKYKTGGIHVGGVAGRFSGLMEQSYNTGAVYNITHATGGIMGAIWKANITNVFNAGNITSYNKNYAKKEHNSGVGGIIGVKAANTDDYLTNIYNIGVIRGFVDESTRHNNVGGIIGVINTNDDQKGTLSIRNAYTRGELFAGIKYGDVYEKQTTGNVNVGAIYGHKIKGKVSHTAVYYIDPSDTRIFNVANSQNAKSIQYKNANEADSYKDANKAGSDEDFHFSYVNGEKKDSGDWRIYDGNYNGANYNSGTTPILDCFRPASAKYFGTADAPQNRDGIDYIQYGTAYNPFMTIMYARDGKQGPIELDFGKIGVSSKGGFAVYNGGLSITNFGTNENQMFNGAIYSDGDLSIDTKNADGSDNGKSIKLGGASELYGSSVTLNTDNGVEIYGKVKATGNAHFKQLASDGKYNYKLVNVSKDRGNVIINGGDIEIYGHVSSAKANYKDGAADASGATQVNGIRGGRNTNNANFNNVGSLDEGSVPDLGEFYAYKSGEYVEGNDSTKHGNGTITITATANDKGAQGTVKAMLGSLDKGYLESFGAMEITGSDIYIDSDLRVGGDLALDAATTVLDISNIGQVDTKNFEGQEATSVEERLHNFLKNFSGEKGHQLIFKNGDKGTTDAIIAADMWNNGAYDLTKYDSNDKTFSDAVYGMNVQKDGTKLGQNDVQKLVHIWVENGEQLKGIQAAVTKSDKTILSKNFALKDDIDMFDVSEYKSIEYFTGNFDGRGNRIIGLGSKDDNGIFGTIGENGSVQDVKIYSSRISGSDNINDSTGLLADINNGTIKDITTFGNRVEVEVKDDTGGGLVGTNSGTISNVTTSDIVTSANGTTLGGIVGTNDGTLKHVTSNSAVVGQNAKALGGVVGVNNGKIEHAASTHGVISGLFGGSTLSDANEYGSSKNVGGVVGSNSGSINSAYNDSYINGWDTIGGVIGTNNNDGKVYNIVNGSEMYGGSNIGGIVGDNKGTIDNGRNNGAIEADAKNVVNVDRTAASGENVGGLAGVNSGKMSNLVNDISAAIEGKTNVGGIIGLNQGFLSSAQNLMNQGEILGMKYVGGVVGKNDDEGVILDVENTNNYTLGYNSAYENDKDTENGEYFGGIVGHNTGTVGDAKNNAAITVNNEKVKYVGGIIGKNDGKIAQAGKKFEDANGKKITADGYLINNGTVSAENSDFVGGLIGENNGAISKTNLINSITGEVSGKNNVGGLIGHNTGKVAGGRDDDNNYYAYQVYNNGTVSGKNNVGGLIGDNGAKGSLTAGYNTGVITGNTNVGGVVGNNAADATVDQVFNAGKVKGTANNGTVVGNNDGTVKNAYDMEKGVEDAVGKGNALAAENADNWATYGDTYGTQKLLKVFLTKLQFVPEKGQETALSNLVYDAKNHTIAVKAEDDKVKVFKDNVEIGYFKTASSDNNAAHSLADYLNTMNEKGLSALLTGNSFKDAGDYQLFNTQQIDTKGIKDTNNPNNLGFDVTDIKVDYNGNPPTLEPGEWEDKYSWYYGWDKKREERERKAEVHFIDGGMEIN